MNKLADGRGKNGWRTVAEIFLGFMLIISIYLMMKNGRRARAAEARATEAEAALAVERKEKSDLQIQLDACWRIRTRTKPA